MDNQLSSEHWLSLEEYWFNILYSVAYKYDNCSIAEEDSNQTYVGTSRNIVLVP